MLEHGRAPQPKTVITANRRPFSVVICTGSEHHIAHGMVGDCDMTAGILYGTTDVCQMSEIVIDKYNLWSKG